MDRHPKHYNIIIGAGFSGNFYSYVHNNNRQSSTIMMSDRLGTFFNYPSLLGRGFKWSPVIGKILSELALDITPSFDLSLFKLNI